MTPEEYEQFVRTILQERVDDPTAIVHGSRHYEGKLSGHPHQIDVSYEFEYGGNSFLVIVECKRYKRPVGIDDLFILFGRQHDISAQKSICVTTTGFQTGAVRLARAVGIGLIRASLVDAIADCHDILPSRDAGSELVPPSSRILLDAKNMYESTLKDKVFPDSWTCFNRATDTELSRKALFAASQIGRIVADEALKAQRPSEEGHE